MLSVCYQASTGFWKFERKHATDQIWPMLPNIETGISLWNNVNLLTFPITLSTRILCLGIVCVLFTSPSSKPILSFKKGVIFKQRPSLFRSFSISKPLSAMIVSPFSSFPVYSFALRVSKKPDLKTILFV